MMVRRSLFGIVIAGGLVWFAVLLGTSSAAAAPGDFVSTWDTRRVSAGSSGEDQVRLPLESVGEYDFTVDWGDHTSSVVTAFDDPDATHTYAAQGSYTLTISGTIKGWRFNYAGDRLKIGDVSQWGDFNPGGNGGQFAGAGNLTASATDAPDLTGVTNMSSMFAGATAFNGNVSDWDTSSVGAMSHMFSQATAFNGDVGGWDTSNVIYMNSMFSWATSFDGDVSGWNTSSVTNMGSMFAEATAFDGDVSTWDTGSVENMGGMFSGAIAFNGDVSGWDTSSVQGMSNMFRGATAFNGDVGRWETGSVQGMAGMFGWATSFNGDVSRWDTSGVGSMANMFEGATAFSGDVKHWDTGSVQSMSDMFKGATAFNGDVGGWDTSSVTDMSGVFARATSFDRDLGDWDVTGLRRAPGMFADAGLSVANYDALLQGWGSQNVQQGVSFDAGSSQYSQAAAAARARLVDDFEWQVTDGGLASSPADDFVSTWDTTRTSDGSSGEDQVRLPLESDGEYDFTVDWGDGTSSEVTAFDDDDVTHTYAAPGSYTLTISGTIKGWRFNNAGDRLKIGDVSQWGGFNPGSNGGQFFGAGNLTASATDAPDLTGVTNLDRMFSRATSFNGDVSSWDTSSVTRMIGTFAQAALFNGDVSGWDTSAVTSMATMFWGATAFDGDVSDWDTGSVTDMGYMFSEAIAFDGDVSNWHTGSVESMGGMFSGATAFSGDVSGWDTGRVFDMGSMFAGATSFDRDLGEWNVTGLADASEMFAGAGLSVANYDALLIGWSGQNVQPDVGFGAGSSRYSQAAVAARDLLVGTHGWRVSDGGPVSSPADDFVSTWDTTRTSAGSSADDQVRLPLESDGEYDFTVDWGDGTTSRITAFDDPDVTHTYAAPGSYTLRISGTLRGWRFNSAGDLLKIGDVSQWGDFNPGDNGHQFANAQNLTASATDAPDLTGVTSLSHMFMNADAFNGDLSSWDTSGVTDMSGVFADTDTFDGDVGGWNTSSVTDMSGMFNGARAFNRDLSSWDTSNVTDMHGMFSSAMAFNGDVGGWETGSVSSMRSMFEGAAAFNRDVGSWDTGSVTTMTLMFASAAVFNGDLSGWDTSSVTDMSGMFRYANGFDGDVSTWVTSAVTDMSRMFEGARRFNGDASAWDTGSVTTTSFMFAGATAFNADVSGWDTGSVTDMSRMFSQATAFNGDVSQWDTSTVMDMSGTFADARSFNGDVSGWDTGSVTTMDYLFYGALAFTGDVSDWDTSSVERMGFLFGYATAFNGDVSEWDTSRAIHMSGMFSGATAFNGDVSAWDTSRVEYMNSMFSTAVSFTGDLSEWDTSSVTQMDSMFYEATAFDGSIGAWDTGAVRSANSMFAGATSFDQDISQWDVTRLEDARMFARAGLSVANYDALLEGWSRQALMQGVPFDAGSSRYSQAAATARSTLVDTYEWQVSDGGLASPPEDDFVSAWDTTRTSDGSSADNQIALPLEGDGEYDFTVDWGDGTTSRVTAFDDPDITHTYAAPGSYTLRISGTLKGWRFNSAGDRDKIGDVSQWGAFNPGSNGHQFAGATNLTASATDAPDLTGVTNFSYMFLNAASFNGIVSGWDTSSVTNMSGMFEGATSFNGDLGGVGNVAGPAGFAAAAVPFEDQADGWNTSSVTDMSRMFFGATAFNGYVGGLNTSSVTNMSSMFEGATSFDGAVGSWDTGNVTDMSRMFAGATSFDQNIGQWNLSSVATMAGMFAGAGLSVENYDALLIGWSSQGQLAPGVPFDAGNSQYSSAAAAAVATLVDTFGWQVTDGGPLPVPEFSATPGSVGFGDQLTGTTSPAQAVTVTNTGTGPLTFGAGAVSLAGADPGQFAIAADGCSTRTVAPSQSCEVSVRFAPTTIRAKSAALRFVSTAASSPDTVALTGTGVAATAPSAPRSVTGTPGNGRVTVEWDAPSSNGGASITGYRVTSSPGGRTCTTSGARSCTVTGLTNGTGYRFTVVAINAVGTSPASQPSALVTPRTVPTAPRSVTGTPGNGRVTVEWDAPSSNGGASITGYRVTSGPGGLTCSTSGARSCTVTGLTNGTGYRFTVVAINAAGTSPASQPSSVVTPRTVPTAPRSVTGTPGNGRVTVRWVAPARNGGAPVTEYRVTGTPGGRTCTTSGALSCTVTGLTNGRSYTFTVVARNAAGWSPASAPSSAVIPRR